MQSPPIDESSRVLHDAAAGMRKLGAAMLMFGMYAGGLVGVLSRMWSSPPAWVIMLRVAACLMPGVMMFVLAPFVVRRHFWAVVVALCITSVASLCALTSAGVVIVFAVGKRNAEGLYVVIAITTGFAAGSGWIAYRLTRCFKVIRPPSDRGFEPVMPVAVLPPERHE